MSCFDVQILDPSINTIEIETCIGNQPSSIDIITYDNTSIVEVNHCIALLPSEIVKDILAGSGIAVISTSGIYTISLNNPNLTSNDISDFLESVQDIIGQSGLISGNYVNLNYNDTTGFTTISVTGLQPSGNYSVIGHTHTYQDITDFNSAVSGLIPPSNFTSLTGVSGVTVSNNGTNYIVSLTDSTIQLIDITDLSSNARSFLLTPSSSNLLSLITDETGSGTLVFNNSPSLSGIPTAPTAPNGTNNNQIANTAFVRTEISNLINSAPSTLDTLNELASALGNDPNFATTITNSLASKAALNGAIFTGSVTIPSGTGNFNSLTVNNIGVSLNGHSHSTSDITNFNINVSGLLPEVTGSSYINTLFNNNIYTISVTGLQPSGNYSVVGHTHISTDITDFNNTVSGLLPVKNITAGSGIGISSLSGDFTISVTGTFGLTSEEVDDRINSLLVPGNYTKLDYNDNLNTLTISVTGVQPIGNYSIVGHNHTTNDIINFASGVSDSLTTALLSGSFINLTYDSILDTLTINATGLQPSGNYSVIGHSHASSDITDFNSSVSGLLPSVSGSGYVNTSFNNNIYTISVSGLQPSGSYASGVHSHGNITSSGTIGSTSGLLVITENSGILTTTSGISSSYITNFNSSVSGLLPTINNSGDNRLLTSNGTATGIDAESDLLFDNGGGVSHVQFRGSLGGLISFDDALNNTIGYSFGQTQITSESGIELYLSNTSRMLIDSSGLYYNNTPISISGHTHTSSNITDFNSSVSGLLPVKNLTAGSGIGISSLSGDFTISVTGTFGLTSEEVDDRVNSLLVPGNYTNLNYNDNLNTLTISVTGVQPSGNYSITGHSHVIADVSGLQNALDNKQPSGSYAPLVHSHVSSDITNFNSSVSGLLPVTNILSGVGISVSNSSGVYTIEATESGILSDQAKSLVTTVFNKTGSPIPKMTAVYINGGQGDLPTVSLAIATSDMTSAGTYGLTYETIPNMQSGQVIVFGALTGLNTDQFNPTAPQGDVNGSVLYLSPSVSGSLTLTKPGAPNHIVAIGTIVRTHQNEGVIEVRVQNGFELEELHNVAISGVTNGQFLQYNSGTQLWVPSSSGNFSTLQVNGTGVSLSGHTHTSSSITDFNSSVSGLLPSISGSTYITSNFNNNVYTISVSGLQPSGDYSVVGHNHTIITKHSLQSDLNALALNGINYTYIFNTGAEESSLVLPTAVNNTSIYTLKNNTDGIIYIKTSNSETVDNYSPTPSPSGTVIGLNIKYSSIMLISDNSGWLIV